MTNPRKRKIFRLFDDTSRFLSRKKVEVDKSQINRLFANIYSPGPSFQYIFDFATRKFVYISNDVVELFGKSVDKFNVDEFLNAIHPHDMPHFIKCEEIAAYFLFSFIDREFIPDYKISYQIRIQNRTGNYKLFLHQAIALSMDDNNNLASAFVNHSDISHITTSNNYQVSFINIKGGKSYFNIRNVTDFKIQSIPACKLSNREIEILGLISEGLSSKEIAENLSISYDTVRTHRNNVLKKTRFNTLTQAIGYFIREGLI